MPISLFFFIFTQQKLILMNYLIEYIEQRLELLKLDASEKAFRAGALFVYFSCFMLLFVFFVALLTFGLSIWLGGLLGKYSYGLFILGAFYLLLCLILYLFRKTIQKKIINLLIKAFK